MANITTTGTTGFPSAIDTRTTLTDGSSGDEIVSANVNGVSAAALAIETELGTDPAGSATDLKTRLAVAHNDAGAVTLGTAASTVGILPFNRGGIGETVASATITTGSTLVYWNNVWQVASPTNGTGLTWNLTSGTYSVGLASTAKISGDLVQMRFATVTGFTTTAGTIPVDNTPPQSTEGQDFGLSVDILPTSTANKIVVRWSVTGTNDTSAFNGAALFIGASSSAVEAWPFTSGAAANAAVAYGEWKATSVSAATTTYTLRLGGGAGTFTLNGQSGAGLFGNSVTSMITAYEIQN